MDKNLAHVIKDQLIGEYSGHMASIPYNPVIFGIVMGLVNSHRSENQYKTTVDQSLAFVLRGIADALDTPAPQPETGADIMNALEEFRDEVNRHSRNSSELFSDETTETIIQALTAQLTARKVDAQTWFDKLREHKAKMPTHDFTPDEFRAWDNERNILMHDLWRAAVKPAPASDDGVK